MKFNPPVSLKRTTLGLLALLATITFIYAQERREGAGAGRSAPARAPAARAPAASADRANHGSIRHADTNVAPRPAPAAVQRGPVGTQHGIASRDVEADINRNRHWNSFVFGARIGVLGVGFRPFFWNGSPYYYDDGIYYQPYEGGYQEVYAPVGATAPELPDGAMLAEGGSVPYYYAGGVFYVEEAGGYVITAAPMGVTVPELPPGANQVNLNGNIAYQFNGTYFQPVFVNGVTQFMTVPA